MKRFFSIFLTIALFFSALPCHFSVEANASSPLNQEPEYAEGEVLVTTTNSKLSLDHHSLAEDEEIDIENRWNFDNLEITEIHSDSLSTEELIHTLSDEDNVIAVEPNYIRKKMTTNDNYRPYQWYLNGNPNKPETSLGIQEEQVSHNSDDNSPIVAVVDTGIDYTHEDLKEHMWVNPYPSLKGTYGYDFANDDDDPMDQDEDGHGTHCAGIISAVRDNECGIAGISDARLMALNIFDSHGEAKDSYIIDAFQYIYDAQNLGANIAAVNCSWGSGGSTPTSEKKLIEKIGAKGALFVFAAGNEGSNCDSSSSANTCPFDIKSDYAVIVGSSDDDDKVSSFSNYGQKNVTLFAPGNNMLSTVNENTFVPLIYNEEQRKNLCSYFSSFDTEDTTFYTGGQLGLRNNVTYQNQSFSNVDFYNSKQSGSLCVDIQSFRNSASFSLYMDVTDLNLPTNQTYAISYDIGWEEDGAITWEHNISYRNRSSFYQYHGRVLLRFVDLVSDFRSIPNVYIDNPAISVACESSPDFGKYNVMNGTSMAAPCVSAAVALLAGQFPSDTSLQRKSKLLQCIRPCKSMKTKCSSGGVLDLSKIQTLSSSPLKQPGTTSSVVTSPKKIAVTKIKLNKKKASLTYGKTLKLKVTTILPKNATNKKMKWSVSKKSYASVSSKGIVKAKKKGIHHTVKIYAQAADGSKTKAVCRVTIKKRRS